MVGFIAPIVAIVLSFSSDYERESLDYKEMVLIVASSVITANLANLILGSIMCSTILLCRKYTINPDNIATPIAASLGDVTTLVLLAYTSHWLYSLISLPASDPVTLSSLFLSNQSEDRRIVSSLFLSNQSDDRLVHSRIVSSLFLSNQSDDRLVHSSRMGPQAETLNDNTLLQDSLLLLLMTLIPLWAYLARSNPYTRNVIVTGWFPVCGAMLLQNAGGLVMERACEAFEKLAKFQPIINGTDSSL